MLILNSDSTLLVFNNVDAISVHPKYPVFLLAFAKATL